MEDLISKRELLERYGVSYGALYRWKRMGLIPEDWFLRRATPTGQETFFHRAQICPRVEQILQRGDTSLEDLAEKLREPERHAHRDGPLYQPPLPAGGTEKHYIDRGRAGAGAPAKAEGSSSEMKQNLNCSGSTRVDGGEYGEVRVSASLRVDGDLRCDTLQCSGSAKIEGALSCAGEVRCSGSVKVAGEAAMQEGRFSGSVKAQSLHCTGTLQCSGSAKTEGGMQLGKARFSGSCAAEGDIHAEELEIAGSLRAPAVEAERFHASGVFRIDGLLNAGEIILSRGGLYQAGDIGCTTLRVVQDAHVISLGRRKRALEAQSIEGDTLELLDTQAAVVRGRFVCVGAGCVIDRVEYSEDLTVEDGGIVKEPVRC